MIKVIGMATSPIARRGEVIEVDEDSRTIKHYLTVGVLALAPEPETPKPKPKRKKKPAKKAWDTPQVLETAERPPDDLPVTTDPPSDNPPMEPSEE